MTVLRALAGALGLACAASALALPKFAPLKNDLMIRAALGQRVERAPVWLFRQAGRHMPEYRAYKEKTSKNFLELLASPDDVCEVTMQPVRRYNIDAAILFSDILVIAEAYGVEVTMPGGVGIQVPHPIVPSDVAGLPERIDVHDKLSHVLAAVTKIRVALDGDVPLIGFSAAPWTLLFYMVGASSKKNQEEPMRWLKEEPEASRKLLALLTATVVDYMVAQVEAGAQMLQLFEAMGEHIDEEHLDAFAMPCLQQIATDLRKRCPGVPLMVFARGACYANERLQEAGFDVVTIDTDTSRSDTRAALAAAAAKSGAQPACLQGNIDPACLRACDGATEDDVRAEVLKCTAQLGGDGQKWIANLGEGLMGNEDPALVACLVDTVHEVTEEAAKAAGPAR